MRVSTLLLIAALVCPAQQVSGPKSPLVQAGGGIKIVVLQGEGAVNNVRTRIAQPLAVEVRDNNDKPVPGAEVIFQLPAGGPGGVFNGWMRNQTARTNAEGRAETNGYAPNDQEGRFNIKVTATAGTKTASTIIAQSNGSGKNGGAQAKSTHSGMWKVIAVIGAAGLAGGIYAATRGGSSTEPVTTPVTINAGPITVGGPR